VMRAIPILICVAVSWRKIGLTGEHRELDIDELYVIYSDNNFRNTVVPKNRIGGRVNSPSVVVLMALIV
jgi:hypothetical protein